VGDHPVKVSPELFTEWLSEAMLEYDSKPGTVASLVADKAAQWGADQELEASVNWLIENQNPRWAEALRAARRPKPPSLAEQATTALHAIASGANDARDQCHDIATVTAALKRLAELEANQ
jgi:hypothetical protein